MSKRVIDKIVKVEITKCDFCDFEREDNRGCCGTAPIMTCQFCKKHVCNKHRELSYHTQGDYPDMCSCLDCKPLMDEKISKYYEKQRRIWEIENEED